MTVAAPAPQPAPGGRPFWVPTGVKFDALPKSLQGAITEILTPAYHELVLEAPNPLEKATGLTFVHLLWLELVEQHELGRAMGPLLARGEGSTAHCQAIARHVRLVGAKEKFGKFLLRVKDLGESGRRGRGPTLGGPG
jgi:hypothetical protein